MIWGYFFSKRKSELLFVEGNIDSTKCFTVLENTMLLFIENKQPRREIFQQDNASCHVSEYNTKQFFDTGVNDMSWPGCSLDQNPIENLWAILAQRVDNNVSSHVSIIQKKHKSMLCILQTILYDKTWRFLSLNASLLSLIQAVVQLSTKATKILNSIIWRFSISHEIAALFTEYRHFVFYRYVLIQLL